MTLRRLTKSMTLDIIAQTRLSGREILQSIFQKEHLSAEATQNMVNRARNRKYKYAPGGGKAPRLFAKGKGGQRAMARHLKLVAQEGKP